MPIAKDDIYSIMVYTVIVVETVPRYAYCCSAAYARYWSSNAIQPDARDLAVGGIRFRTAPFFIGLYVLAKLGPFGYIEKLSTRVLHASLARQIFFKKIKKN